MSDELPSWTIFYEVCVETLFLFIVIDQFISPSVVVKIDHDFK